MTYKEKPICQACKSDDVRADAYAAWNVEKQEWEISVTFNKGAVCETCGEETRLEWVNVGKNEYVAT